MRSLRILPLIALLSLSACKFKATLSNGDQLKGAGITFLVPSETSSSSSGSDGITFDSDTVKAKTDGKSLTVNGVNHGPVKSGDQVDLRGAGKVLVNGVTREPVK